jgi:hypothetical protein
MIFTHRDFPTFPPLVTQGAHPFDFAPDPWYNRHMAKTCNQNPVIKTIRILLSLTVMGLGIYYKTWLGLLGFLTLFSAFQGGCPLSINLDPHQTRLGDSPRDDSKEP